MKLTSILAAGLLMSVFAASDARADQFCSLSVSPSSYIALGEAYSFGVDIAACSGLGNPPFTVVFYGTRNGVFDTPGGQTYPGSFGFGHSTLGGLQNPLSGGFGGDYVRYAVVYSPSGYYCTTNAVEVELQDVVSCPSGFYSCGDGACVKSGSACP
jgi:hypothetical protein